LLGLVSVGWFSLEFVPGGSADAAHVCESVSASLGLVSVSWFSLEFVPGDAAHVCESVSASVLAAASNDALSTFTTGVPACEYHFSNWREIGVVGVSQGAEVE